MQFDFKTLRVDIYGLESHSEIEMTHLILELYSKTTPNVKSCNILIYCRDANPNALQN